MGVVLFAMACGLTAYGPMTGCESKPPTPANTGFASPDRYTTRGVIVELPDAKRVGNPDLMIQHERIADFKDSSGKVVGMNSMIMDFPLAPGLSIAGLAKGDKVEVVMEVDWSQLPPHRAASIKKIDAATVLDFSNPKK
ncbi:MAG: copper-binding protein [Planctomycetes bacterium]|nr:copper-binding protein [Planctomycetota bacterium]